MSLFERKVKGQNTVLAMRMMNPQPYPPKSIRWQKYGAPLTNLFGQYFDEIAVEYFKDTKGRLDQINLICYEANFKYKKSEETNFNVNLFRAFSNLIQQFSINTGIKAEIAGLYAPDSPSSFEYMKDKVIEKTEKKSENKTMKSLPKGIKPAIIKSPDTNEEDLIVSLGKSDASDIQKEGMTIQMSEDGRFFVGYISKKDGKRYYIQLPEKEAKRILNETKKAED